MDIEQMEWSERLRVLMPQQVTSDMLDDLADEIDRLQGELGEVKNAYINARAAMRDADQARGIDDRYGGVLAFMLECAILDPHGYFDAACRLLDEYKAEWEKVNPSPPTFMGEPMPPERRERLIAAMDERRRREKECSY